MRICMYIYIYFLSIKNITNFFYFILENYVLNFILIFTLENKIKFYIFKYFISLNNKDRLTYFDICYCRSRCLAGHWYLRSSPFAQGSASILPPTRAILSQTPPRSFEHVLRRWRISSNHGEMWSASATSPILAHLRIHLYLHKETGISTMKRFVETQ